MLRSRRHHLLMSRMALVAVLLLLIVPTVGRIVGAVAQSEGVWAQMCTMAGLQLVKIPLTDPVSDARTGNADSASAGAGMPGGDMPVDCDYCPLLGALTAVLLWWALVFPRRVAAIVPTWRPALPRPLRHPSGLGSRGPPIAL